MIGKCKKCNHAEYFDKNDEWGIRLKLKDQRCECGGKFEKMYPCNEPDLYITHNGKVWELMPMGEFRDYEMYHKGKQ